MAELTKTILIADDEASGRAFLKEILSQAGFTVVEASDGTEAYDLIKKQVPDLLITDRGMPGLGGLELLKKLRDEKISVKSLVVSAYGEESFWNKAITYGAVDYLMKPFQAEDVMKIVQKVFGGKTK